MRPRRRALAFLLLPAVAALALVGAGLMTRGLHVVVQNKTTAPLIDLRIAHPGGVATVARLAPGASVDLTIRAPLAGLRDGTGELPLVAAFVHEGDRSEPFALRCELPWFGTSRLDLSATSPDYPPRHRSVDLDATMVGHFEVDHRRLLRNLLDPKVGPRQFYHYYHESLGTTVLCRRHWPNAFRHQLVAAGQLAGLWQSDPIAARWHLLVHAAETIQEFAPRRPDPPRISRLPFRSLADAQQEPGAGFVLSAWLP